MRREGGGDTQREEDVEDRETEKERREGESLTITLQ